MKNVDETNQTLFEASLFHLLSDEVAVLIDLEEEDTTYYRLVGDRYDQLWERLAKADFQLLSVVGFMSACAVHGCQPDMAHETASKLLATWRSA